MTPRRFNLADAIALVVASSLALAWTRAVVPRVVFNARLGEAWPRVVRMWVPAAVPFLTLGSLALLVIRLRRPRPGLRELAAQPGFMACLVAVLVVPIHILWACVGSNLARLSGWRGGLFQGLDHYAYMLYYLPETGLAVGGCWFALAANGCWKTPPSWLERVGRLLGFSWIVLYLVIRAAEYCM